jgi:hypothetical protein
LRAPHAKPVSRRALSAHPAVEQATGVAPAAKERAKFHVQADLLEHIRKAVVQLSGPPERLTLTDFVERTFRAEVARLEREHNKSTSCSPPAPWRWPAPTDGYGLSLR